MSRVPSIEELGGFPSLERSYMEVKKRNPMCKYNKWQGNLDSAKFIYGNIITRFGCPLVLINDICTCFIIKTIDILMK